MPNTSSSVPFLLSGSMQSIRSRRTSTCLSSGPLGSGSGILQQIGSGMVRQLTSNSGISSPIHHHYNGNTMTANSSNNSANNLNYPVGGASPANRGTFVRKCPSLNITFSTHWFLPRRLIDRFTFRVPFRSVSQLLQLPHYTFLFWFTFSVGYFMHYALPIFITISIKRHIHSTKNILAHTHTHMNT